MLAVVGLILWAGWSSLFPPTGVAVVKTTAAISIDGKVLTSSAIWRVTYMQVWGPDTGSTARESVEGDDVVFDIGDGQYLFLRRSPSEIIDCAYHGPAALRKGPSAAFAQFKGPCTGSSAGVLTLATVKEGSEPSFTRFYIGEGGKADDIIGDAVAVHGLLDRGLAMKGVQYVSTAEQLGRDMTSRFPWIGQLPRICVGGFMARTCMWQRGVTYQEDFTSSLR